MLLPQLSNKQVFCIVLQGYNSICNNRFFLAHRWIGYPPFVYQMFSSDGFEGHHMHHTLGGLRYVVTVSNGLGFWAPEFDPTKTSGFWWKASLKMIPGTKWGQKKWERTCDTSHIYETYVTWIDLIYRDNHHHQHHHGLWPLTDYCFPKVWKSSPCSLVWQMFDQNGRSKIEENLQKVSPPWKLKNTSFFKEGISTEKNNSFIYWKIHGMEALFEGAFFCSVFFFPGLAVVYIQFSLLSGCFRCPGNIPNKGPATKSCWGWLIFHLFVVNNYLKNQRWRHYMNRNIPKEVKGL